MFEKIALKRGGKSFLSTFYIGDFLQMIHHLQISFTPAKLHFPGSPFTSFPLPTPHRNTSTKASSISKKIQKQKPNCDSKSHQSQMWYV